MKAALVQCRLRQQRARMSLHGLTGSMTSWKCTHHLLLLVLLSTIDPSKENCVDYITNKTLAENVNKTIHFVMMNDPKDAVECTASRECEAERKCHIIYHCFNGPIDKERCKGETSEISYHHYLCLLSKVSGHIDTGYSPKACEYETTCKMYSKSASTVFHQTNFPPPTTTLPERTTAATTALSTPPKTTTATTDTTATTATKTITTTTTTATTTTTTTATTTPKTTTTSTRVTQSTYKGSDGVTSLLQNGTENNTENTVLALKIFLVISVLFNIGLVVYLLTWHHRTKQYCIQQCVNCELNRASSEAQQVTEMESSAPQASVEESEIETSHLMKSKECVIMQLADERTGCTVEMQQ